MAFFGDGAVNSGSFHEGHEFWGGVESARRFTFVKTICTRRKWLSAAPPRTPACRAGPPPTRCRAWKWTAVTWRRSMGRRRRPSSGRAADGGPTLIEAKTYRFVGHHEGDPGNRLPDARRGGGVEEPVSHQDAAGETSSRVGWRRPRLERIEAEVRQWLEDAVQFASESPEPAAATVVDHVFG